ncbi:MAG: HAD family hydrolase [Verrucomicrobia bacterium]|nr:HAD family hydrolase [Verrucomicrobiota bacterium]MBV9641981.1 HAD family hydrolase [Verrucomicrobiota bacterium]
MAKRNPAVRKAIFLDRDGTLIRDVGYCSKPDEVELLEGVGKLLPKLKEAGFKIVIITNQSGIGRGYFTEEDFWSVQRELEKQLGAGVIDATYFCADTPQNETERRKPNPGMLFEAARELGIDLEQSYMVGNKMSDAQAGIRAGVRASILFGTNAAVGTMESGATLVAKDFKEVVEFILGK